MVNLFRPAPEQQGSLTAALLALLEHSDKGLLNGLLKRAGIPFQVRSGEPLTIQFPAPEGPPGAGLIAGPDFQIAVAAQHPGEAWEPEEVLRVAAVPLAISLTGQAPHGAHALSWEQVDRWLAAATEQYDHDSRTGFLIEQFRAVLPELGIAYFAGFDQELLEAATEAQATLTQFHKAAGQFFDRVTPAVAAVRPGAAQIRQARPEELLVGYSYRDYSDPALGATGFLRVALNVPHFRLETACWLTPGEAHGRLGDLLADSPGFRGALAALGQDPLLWLWSADGEQKLPLDAFDPDLLENLVWGQYHAGIQIGLPFDEFPAEDLTGRVAALVQSLTVALAPALTGAVH